MIRAPTIRRRPANGDNEVVVGERDEGNRQGEGTTCMREKETRWWWQKRKPPATGRTKRKNGWKGTGREGGLGTFRTREGDEEVRARERSLPPPHLASRSPHARVLVGTKTADPGTNYRPRLSRSLACHGSYPLGSLPTYLPTYLWGGLLLLSHEDADERARLRASERLPRCVSSWPADSSCRGSEPATEHLDRGIG